MPLNREQRVILFTNISGYVDKILESAVDRPKKIEWLKLCTSDVKTTEEEAFQVLQQGSCQSLTKGLAEAVTVPKIVRNHWKLLLNWMAGGAAQPFPQNTLQALLSLQYNNYNPVLIAEMWLFENKINEISEISAIKSDLILLREAYLEMTPLTSDEGVDLRIGQFPFNLNERGQPPRPGEIQSEIKTLIADRLKQADKHDAKLQEEIEKQERIRKEMGAVVIQSRKDVAKAQLAVSEMTEQKTREDFTQAVLSDYRVFEGGAAASRPVRVSDILSSHKNFLASSKQESSTKSERLSEMQRELNNRITNMIGQVTIQMSKEDVEFKKCTLFVEFKVAECCQELLNVQSAIIEEHCVNKDDFDADKINKMYEKQLRTAYSRFLQTKVTNWVSERQGWLSGSDGHALTKAVFTSLSTEFREKIENAMKPALIEFQAFRVTSFSKVSKLNLELKARKEQQDKKVVLCKERSDTASLPLAMLRDQCMQLKQIQINEFDIEYLKKKYQEKLDIFNSAVTALSEVTDSLKFTMVEPAGFNLLQCACWGGNGALVKELLGRGAKADVKDPQKNCLIHLAVENESKEMVEILEMLMKEPSLSNILETKNKQGKIALHAAALFGNLTAVQWIVAMSKERLDVILDMEADGKNRMTPLHYAVREGQEKVIEYLLVLGASRLLRSLDNHHPLVFAIEKRQLGAVHLFARAGIGLISTQIEYLLGIAKRSDSDALNIAYCLAVPAVEALNTVARVVGLAAANSRLMTVAPSTSPVPVAGDQSVSRPSQSAVTHLDVSVLAAALAEPLAKQAEQTEEHGQNLHFDFGGGTTRGRAVPVDVRPAATANDVTLVANNVAPIANATPSADANPTPTVVNAKTTTTATL